MGFLYDGIDDCGFFPDAPTLRVGTVGSISLWFNLSDVTTRKVLITFGLTTATGKNNGIVTDSGSVRAFIRGEADIVGDAISINTGYHVLLTWNSSDVNIYLNGGTPANGSRTFDITNGGGGLGCFLNSTTPTVPEAVSAGQITEVAIYSVEITSASDIFNLAKSRIKRMPLQVQGPSLAAYWPMTNVAHGVSGDGVTIKDISGNGNDATGNDGGNNTGLTGQAEEILSHPVYSGIVAGAVSSKIPIFDHHYRQMRAC